MNATFGLGAFGIIFDAQGRVLLAHRRDMDAWNLPGGAVEPGELPTEAAIREVREETGLEVGIMRLVGVYGKESGDLLVFAFECAVIGGELTTSDESNATTPYSVSQKLQFLTVGDEASHAATPLFTL